MRTKPTIAALLVSLAGMTQGAQAADQIIVTDRDAFGSDGAVFRVDPLTGTRSVLSSNSQPAGGPSFVDPTGLIPDGTGYLLVTDPNAFDGGGGVMVVNPVTGERTVLSSNSQPVGTPNFVQPEGLTLDANGDILVADEGSFGADGAVIRVDRQTGARSIVSSNVHPAGGPQFGNPSSVRVEQGGDLLVADWKDFGLDGQILRVDAETGARTIVSANDAPAGSPELVDPAGVFEGTGAGLIVSDFSAFSGSGALLRIDPVSGVRTTLSSNTDSEGPDFVDPIGFSLEADGDIIVADPALNFPPPGTAGSILRVDPVTGTRTSVSNNIDHAGPLFVHPFVPAVVPAGMAPAPPPAQQPPPSTPTQPETPAPPAPTGPTNGNDLLMGTAGDDRLCGLGGDDVIMGLGGDDTLFGDACGATVAGPTATAAKNGDDSLNGGTGNDRLYGSGGADRLTGGPGKDRLVGGRGRDGLNGGAGRDRISSRDGRRDVVSCGKGSDLVVADRRDRVRGCERVRR